MQVLVQSIDYSKVKEFGYAFFSDLHLDAHDHNRPKLVRDLDLAAKHKCRMYFNGDVFDLILPGDQKRYVRGNDIVDSQAAINQIVEQAVQLFKPYVNLIDGIGVGNHESTIIKHHSVDPIHWLVKELNNLRDKSLPPILHMGYTGYIIHRYHINEKRVRTQKIWYHHGVGGASPSTKGMGTFVKAVYAHDADVYWMGHLHSAAIDPGIERVYLNDKWEPVVKTARGFYTAGYKGGHLHKQVGQYGYSPDYSTEKFINHSSCGMVFMTEQLAVTPGGGDYEIRTQLTTGWS